MNTHVDPPPRPSAFQGDLANLPEALAPLKGLPNWVCWKWEWKVNKRGEGKWDKPPFNPARPHAYARNNDPTTWGTYEQALAVYQRGECNGIGFNLSGTDFGAFDLDDCRGPGTGEIAPEGMEIVDRATSYTECTVSGTGLRVIGYGTPGKKVHRKQMIPNSSVSVESYNSAERYIVVTGNPLPNTWPHIADIGYVMDDLVAELDGQKNNDDSAFDFDTAREQRKSSDDGGADTTFSRMSLPDELQKLIFGGPGPGDDHSRLFHRAVCWLGECGWSATRIEAFIAGKPIVPERFAKRLRQEIERCLRKAKPRQKAGSGGADRSNPGSSSDGQQRAHSAGNGQNKQESPQPFELFWHGKKYDRALRTWLVQDLIPETGKGLLSGQWGTAKTFCGVDLSACVITKMPFAGREVVRSGGVLFVAAEGATEIPIRLQALVEHKLRPALGGLFGNPSAVGLEELPFAWMEESPDLKDDHSFGRLKETAKSAALNIREQFDLPLALIIIDTLSAASNFKDQNDSAEGQFVMNRLNELSRETGAFVLAVDHFGKAVETGTRGASSKEGAADVVLALLGDRQINGTVSNTRMALRKLRGGKTGIETPFDLKVVDLEGGETTCVIEWRGERATNAAPTGKKDRWPKSLRIFRSALTDALAGHGKTTRPFGNEGPVLSTVPIDAVRDEFVKAYAGDTADAKRKAFKRAVTTARENGLIGSREIAGVDHLWLVDLDKQDTTNRTPTPDRQDTY